MSSPHESRRRPRVELTSESTLVELLAGQLARTPDAPAVDDGATRWTYRELHRAAAGIAAALGRIGVAPGEPIGVRADPQASTVAAILGVLHAGGAYVPLDPSYPEARLVEMCKQTRLRLVVGPPGAASLPGVERVVDPIDAAGEALPEVAPHGPRPDSPAYILFTSGSTGRPKGVQVSHRNVVLILKWACAAFGPEAFATAATTTSLSFDPSVLELFGPLVSGGLVHVIAGALAIGRRDLAPTFMASTPSVVAELLRAGRLPTTLHTLALGGEVLSPSLARELLTSTSISRLFNAYGPTETTVLSTAHEVLLPERTPVPIGAELPGVVITLRDADAQLVPDGAEGEIWIAGDTVADGYVGAPELTRERFPEVDGRRWYRSGDRGRRLPNGELEFCGRVDAQLKVRGFRIEPGDVEAALTSHPAVAGALVTASGTGAAAQLVAYVVARSDDVTDEVLRRHARDQLPEYLVPARYVMIDAFPLTPTGKVDVAALPRWVPRRRAVGDPPSIDRLDPTEATVVDIVRSVLGFEGPIARGDDFLDDLGGSSLALVEVLAAMERRFARELPIADVIADTTIGGFTRLARAPAAPTPPVVAVNPNGSRPPLFLFHSYLGSVLRYRRIGPFLPPDQPLVGIHVRDVGAPGLPPPSIETMAEDALGQQLRGLRPSGPYQLGGHSIGGLIAYEVARRLELVGEAVTTVVLLDTPGLSSRAAYYWADAMLNLPEVRNATWSDRRRQLRAIVGSRVSLHRRIAPESRVELAVERAGRLSNLAVGRYRIAGYGGDVTVLRTAQGIRMALGDRSLGWSRRVRGELRCIDVGGAHNTLLSDPFVAEVGRAIAGLLTGASDAVVPSRVGTPPETAGPVTAVVPVAGDLRESLADYGRRRSRRTRVVLFGNYGNGNLGDEAILSGLLGLCRSWADVTVVSRRPARIERDHGVASVAMGSRTAVLALARADLVAIGGGGIFGNDMKLLTELLPLVGIGARWCGKDTAFLAIGAYTSTPVWVQRCLRTVAARSSIVAVRDEESAAVLGSPPTAIVVNDPAIALEAASPERGRAALAAVGIPADRTILGVSMKPTHFPDRNARQVEVVIEVADWWDRHVGGSVALLCLSERGDNGLGATCSDVSMAREVTRRVAAPARVHLLGPEVGPTVLKSAIREMAAVVGHRLHSQIFAASVGTPYLGISYERKADSFLAMTGAPRVDLFGLRSEPVIAWLDELLHPSARVHFHQQVFT